MASLALTDWKSEQTGSVELHEDITSRFISFPIIKDVVVAHLANLQQGTHKTKTRAEVSGSTKKLFRQKGTGSARAGSIKSPLRRHGGIVFGPIPRSHAVKVNKKLKKSALASVLGQYVREKKVRVMEDFVLESHKTSHLNAHLQGWDVSRKDGDQQDASKKKKVKKIIFVGDTDNRNFILASRNLQGVNHVSSQAINVYEILCHDCVVFTKAALLDLEKRILG